jgi:hypothetical protein
MGLTVGTRGAGGYDSFARVAGSRMAVKHMFVVEDKGEGMPSLFALRGVFPNEEVQSFSLEHGNGRIYYPESEDVEPLEVEFYETADNQVGDWYREWSDSMHAYDPDGDRLFALPSVYKRDIYVYRLDTRGDGVVFDRVMGRKYAGCFPLRMSPYPFDMSTPDLMTLWVTLSVDGVGHMRTGESGVSAAADPGLRAAPPDPVQPGAPGSAMAATGTAKWAAMLGRAAARTGVNLAEAEAMRMAYAAGSPVGRPLSASYWGASISKVLI